MDEAGSKPTPAPRWVSLAEYEQQKASLIKSPDLAHDQIVSELVQEGEGRRPCRYKRVGDIEMHWRENGLPLNYYWSDADAQIDWRTSTAIWPERFGPRYRPALKIYAIEVVVWDGPPWVVEPVPADEPIHLEPEPLEPKLELEPEPEPELSEPVPADGAVNDSPVDEAISNAGEQEAEDDTASTEDSTNKGDRLLLILGKLLLNERGELNERGKADMTPAQVTKLVKRPYLKKWPEIEGDPKSKFPDRRTVRRVFKAFIDTQK